MVTQKKDYGWNSELERFLKDNDKTIPSGSFTIQKRSGKLYWYYNLSVKTELSSRLIYLCSVEDNGGELNSFRNSIQKLKDKLGKNSNSTTKSRIKLTKVIDKYISDLEKEGLSSSFGVERTKKTTQDLIYHMRTFREFVERKNVYLNDCVKVEFGDTIIHYVTELKISYKSNTVRRHLTTVKLFLNDLVQPRSGKPLIPSHPVSPLFLKRNFNFKREISTPIQNFYTEEVYNTMFKICGEKVRIIWNTYIKEGIQTVKTSDLVYFISLLQLNYGFRIGEVIETYLNEETFRKYYSGKGGYSYLEKDEDDNNYTFHIFTKNKFGKVYVDYSVFSWTEPPEGFTTNRLTIDEFKTQPYVSNIVEIMNKLFSNKTHLVSLDRSSYFNYFKKVIVESEGFGKFGVSSSHDLRDMCINYLIHTKGYSPTEISQLTRHSIQTLENYYLHRSKKISIQLSEKLKTKGRYKEVKDNIKGNTK